MSNSGQSLWQRAKQVIPGGNMLLSKRGEMFLPDQWPSYFSKAKGCKVWDLDGNEFTDMTIMGIGTNILGYGHPEVDDAVMQTIHSGNMSTLNCPEEVYLAEKLVEMHPWADMVRFARSGGEANAIAIRIARAASGKDKVAVCGYHGWHDWYLSANLSDDKNLDGHLLPGLEPKGVPRNLANTIFPFKYNRFDELEKIVTENDIGVIKMEVIRSEPPKNDFLQKVRNLATKKNIILIFDECTSGFRQSFGGIHKIFGVEPDMAMFGKALGNGYAITATIGKREIMEAAQSTFISSTFWTERIGPTAALKTLEVMEKLKSWDLVTNTGLIIRDRVNKLADKYELEITQWGLPALTGYTFKSDNALAYKTYITQEMLGRGYLVGNSVYVCTEHTDEILDEYFENLAPLFKKIKEFEGGGRHLKFSERASLPCWFPEIELMLTVFRTDVSSEIGIGHFMRCLALAGKLSEVGVKILFVLSECEGWVKDELERRNYFHASLGGFDKDPHKDAISTLLAAKSCFNRDVDWIVVDHYQLDHKWEAQIKLTNAKVLVIDDLANRHHICDLLIDQNLFLDFENRYNGLVPDECIKILGPRYALLRKEFEKLYPSKRKRDGNIERILIFLGGGDANNITSMALTALQEFPENIFQIDVVVGGNNPFTDTVKVITSNMKNASFHQQVSNMAELIDRADLAIGAGGATTWERCLLGLPTLTINFAENQVATTQYIHNLGAIKYLGMGNEISGQELITAISHYLSNPEELLLVSERAKYLMRDWEGAKAIVNHMNLL